MCVQAKLEFDAAVDVLEEGAWHTGLVAYSSDTIVTARLPVLHAPFRLRGDRCDGRCTQRTCWTTHTVAYTFHVARTCDSRGGTAQGHALLHTGSRLHAAQAPMLLAEKRSAVPPSPTLD